MWTTACDQLSSDNLLRNMKQMFIFLFVDLSLFLSLSRNL